MVFIVAVGNDDDHIRTPIAAMLYEVCLLQKAASFVPEYVYVPRTFGSYETNRYGLPFDDDVLSMVNDENYLRMLRESEVRKEGIYVDKRLMIDEHSARACVYAVKASTSKGYLSMFVGGHTTPGIGGPSMGMALLVECCHPQKYRIAFTGATHDSGLETLDRSIGHLNAKIAVCKKAGCPLVFDLPDVIQYRRLETQGVHLVLPDDLAKNKKIDNKSYNVYTASSLVEAVFAAMVIDNTLQYKKWIRALPSIGKPRIGKKMSLKLEREGLPFRVDVTFDENADKVHWYLVERQDSSDDEVEDEVNDDSSDDEDEDEVNDDRLFLPVIKRGVKRLRDWIGASGIEPAPRTL